MAFHESYESFAAAMAFLDEALSDSSATEHSQHGAALPSLTDGEWDPNLSLDNIDDFLEDSNETMINPLAVDTPTSLVALPHQFQLETTSHNVEEVESKSKSRKSKRRETKKPLNYDPNKARNSRRFQLIHLRAEAQELEMKLQQLKVMQEREDARLGRKSKMCTKAKKTPAVWEEICNRQLERRLTAERMNILLKKKCEKGKQVARSIETMIRKRLAQEDAGLSGFIQPTRRVRIPPGFSSNITSRIFEELSAGVEASYYEVDSVFQDNSGTPSLPRNRSLLRDSINDMQVDLVYGKVMPFDVGAIGDAWWTRWHKYKGQRTNQSEENTIAEKFGLEMRDVKTNTTATFYDQQILRRYKENDRIVIVWRAYIEPLEFEKRPVSGLYFLEKGYVLITPHDHEEEGGDNSPFSNVSTCYMLTPKAIGRRLRHDSRTISLVDFVSNTVSANMSMIIEKVENMLLDQSIHKHKAC